MSTAPLLFALALNAGPVADTPTTDELVRQIKDSDPRNRRLAAEALGRRKAEAAILPLAELLKDREAAVRAAAAAALARVGSKSVPALAATLSGDDEPARLAALTALERLGPDAKGAVEALAAALKGKDADLRIRAAGVLGRIGPSAKAALPALFDAAKDTANVGPIMRPNTPSSIAEAAVAAALKIDPDCGEALAKAVLPGLTEALKGKDTAVLQAAGGALAKLGPHAKPALPALEDARPRAGGFAEYSVRAAIVAAGGDVTGPLAALIRDTEAPLDKRLRAVSELGYRRSGTGPAVAILLEALKDEEPRLRAGAADALGTLGADAKEAIPALLARLDDEKLEAAAAGGRIAAQLPLVPYALSRIGKDATAGLAEVLKDEKKSPLTRYHAAVALGNLGARARAARPALEAALNDRYAAVAMESAAAYVRTGEGVGKAVPVVLAGLRHEAAFIARLATGAAERMGGRGKDLVQGLTPLLDHEDREVRIGAARALSATGPSAKAAVPAMAKLLQSDDDRQRYQVAAALARFGPDAAEAVPALVACLKRKDVGGSSPDPVIEALGAIGPGAKDAVPALLEVLKQRRRLIDTDILVALGAIGPSAKDAVPQLLPLLADRNVYTRAAAARALGGVGPSAKEAVPALTRMLDDEERKGRVWAAFALARITGETEKRVGYLAELWEDDRAEGPLLGVDYDLAQALELLGPDARPARDVLLELVTNERTGAGTRLHAARALGGLAGDAEVIVPRMVELLGRPAKGSHLAGYESAAAEALGLLGPKARSAVPALRKVLGDDEDEAVDAARKALERIGQE